MEKTIVSIIRELEDLGDQAVVEAKKKKFGVQSSNALGVYHRDLKKIAKTIGKNKALAIQLFDTEIYEARILCSQLFPPEELTETLMEQWVVTFNNWEICDSFSMGLFAKSPFAIAKIQLWSERVPEFEKRACFATIAAYCMADKKASNEVFEQFFPLIKKAATDERLYVKKAVNWALRSIGKRNIDLNKRAIEEARKLLSIQARSAQWIAKDALRELQHQKVNILDYPRNIYRPNR